ncbi:MAG: hypothetical protein HON90_13470 [Halobacteriovoraceae bacterium]|jgi:hypothetical protein|nr:hypothetical protein [Halobacteriovoraceae bacterium]
MRGLFAIIVLSLSYNTHARTLLPSQLKIVNTSDPKVQKKEANFEYFVSPDPKKNTFSFGSDNAIKNTAINKELNRLRGEIYKELVYAQGHTRKIEFSPSKIKGPTLSIGTEALQKMRKQASEQTMSFILSLVRSKTDIKTIRQQLRCGMIDDNEQLIPNCKKLIDGDLKNLRVIRKGYYLSEQKLTKMNWNKLKHELASQNYCQKQGSNGKSIFYTGAGCGLVRSKLPNLDVKAFIEDISSEIDESEKLYSLIKQNSLQLNMNPTKLVSILLDNDLAQARKKMFDILYSNEMDSFYSSMRLKYLSNLKGQDIVEVLDSSFSLEQIVDFPREEEGDSEKSSSLPRVEKDSIPQAMSL